MKKTILSLFAMLCLVSVNAQFGVKAGLTFDADGGVFKALSDAYQKDGKGKVGYHVGIFKKINLPMIFIQPEVQYVNYEVEYTESNSNTFKTNYKRIDVPVSVGTNLFLGLAQVQIGSVLSYYFEDDIKMDDVSDIKQDDFSIGMQLGAAINLKKLVVSARYDFPIGKRETNFLDNNNISFQTDNTPKLLHLSLGYKF